MALRGHIRAALAALALGILLATVAGGSPEGPRHNLPGSSLHRWLPVPAVTDYSAVWELPTGYSHWAISQEHNAVAYGRIKSPPWTLGHIRRGQRIPVRLMANGHGCKEGDWYRGDQRGTVCTTMGFSVTTRPPASTEITHARLNQPLPYKYVRVVKGGPRLEYNAVPTQEQAKKIESALASGEDLPEVVERKVEGAFFVAVDRLVWAGSGSYYRTVRQTYVRKDETAPVPTPAMHGEVLGDGLDLPLAFVYAERGAYLFCPGSRDLVVCGRAQRHSRFQVTGLSRVGDLSYARGAGGYMALTAAVRVARPRKRPAEVEATAKWVHFDLKQQVMVAYEGDRPVYATLFSSGKAGYETQPGLFNIFTKWVSDRMVGTDEKEGPYDIDEVPWVMYYRNSLAVHGAYWHDTFGEVRSHGCTNLSPADARWLFYWTDNPLPVGWHGLNIGKGNGKGKGTTFLFTK